MMIRRFSDEFLGILFPAHSPVDEEPLHAIITSQLPGMFRLPEINSATTQRQVSLSRMLGCHQTKH
jgi:hypothetical protein